MQLQVTSGEVVLDLDIEEGTISADGEEVDVHVTRLSEHTLHLLVDGRSFVVTAVRTDEHTVRVTHAGRTREVRLKTERDLLLQRLGMDAAEETAAIELRAPMPGLVLDVLVEAGAEVEAGDGLVVLEAMKMENELRAGVAGRVEAVHVQTGEAVTKNDLLVSFA